VLTQVLSTRVLTGALEGTILFGEFDVERVIIWDKITIFLLKMDQFLF